MDINKWNKLKTFKDNLKNYEIIKVKPKHNSWVFDNGRIKIANNFKFVFKINEFVASAIAHLKLSSKDAWNLTMPEFQLAVDSLFPEDPKKANMPTQDEVEESFRKVREARARYEKMQQDKPPKKQKPSRQRY